MSNEKKAPAAPTAERAHTRVQCIAIGGGFYAGNRIRYGMTFTLAADKDFSATWMRDVSEATPDQFAARHAPIGERRGNKRTSRDIPKLTAPAPVGLPAVPAAAAAATDNNVL